MSKKISRLNLLAYGSLAALGMFFIVLELATGSGKELGWHASTYYFSLLGRSLEELAVGGAYFAAMLLIFLVIASQARNFAMLLRGRGGKPMILGSGTFLGALRNGAKRIWQAVLIMLPAFIFIILVSLLLEGLNTFDRARLMDTALLRLEPALFGGYAFIVLGSVHYPAFLSQFIVFSFENMSGILLLAAFLLACFDLRLLRELVGSFCLCMLLMIPLWFVFPALSPHDRFLDNVYRLPVSAQMAAAITMYHPVPAIAGFLADIRTGKNGLSSLPTSTMPSAHVAWAALAGYYLFRAKKWLGWVALPFLIASTAGTVILAQHYFIDIPLSLVISALAIWIAYLISFHKISSESP